MRSRIRGATSRLTTPRSKFTSSSDQPDRLGLLRVPGFHGSNDQEACIDWLDIQFGRSTRVWDNHFLFPWDLDKWRANSKETVDLTRYPAADHATLSAARVSQSAWMLGESNLR